MCIKLNAHLAIKRGFTLCTADHKPLARETCTDPENISEGWLVQRDIHVCQGRGGGGPKHVFGNLTM